MTLSRLLLLPKELRLCIWENTFCNEGDIIIGAASRVPWQGRPRQYHAPLLEVCHQIRHEALPLFYKDRRVVLLLRFREGRQQIHSWIVRVLKDSRIARNIHDVSIQLFEECHRSTSMLIDLRNMQVLNRENWIHPLTLQALKPLLAVDQILEHRRTLPQNASETIPQILSKLIDAMMAPLRDSKLGRMESMANLRLHGYTDFQLRFEVISIMYHEVS